MQKHRHLIVLALFVLPLILSGQNTLYFSGGVSYSQIPIYSQKSNSRLIDSYASNKLTFSFAFQQPINNYFTTSAGISYSNLGINTFNQQLDQEDYFLNSVSIEYLSLSYVPKGEIKLRKLTLAAGIGGSVGFAIGNKAQNYSLFENNIEFIDREDTHIKNFDAGVVFNLELKRMIGNGLNLVLLLERYQGLIDASTNIDNLNKIYISSSAMRIGMQFPINRKRPSLIEN